MSNPEIASDTTISIKDLLTESVTRLKGHHSLEIDNDSKEDGTLNGLIILSKELLSCYIKGSDYDEVVAFVKKHQLLHEFYYENLYYMPERTLSPH